MLSTYSKEPQDDHAGAHHVGVYVLEERSIKILIYVTSQVTVM